MAELTLRQAGPGDAGRIAELHTRSRASAYRGLLPDDYLDRVMPAAMGPYWDRRLRELEGGAGIALLAERDGQTLAFVCAVAPDARQSVLVDNLHAHPDRRGAGAGTRLLEAVADWARARGARRMHLLVIEGNEAAAGFYESRGWRRQAREDDEMDGLPVVSLRYVRALDPAAGD